MALTENAERVLIAAARMKGEPEEEFMITDLARYCNVEERFEPQVFGSGLRAHTLPALMRRRFVKRTRWGYYVLTHDGFEEALILSGGRGLL